MNAVQFFVIVANTRAYTQGLYIWTAVTDLVFCLVVFRLTKRIAASDDWRDQVGYAAGGTVGAQLGIYVTKLLFGA